MKCDMLNNIPMKYAKNMIEFENIKYTDIILKDYVDLVKDYFCENNK